MIKKIKYLDSVIEYDLIKSKRRKTSQITITPDKITIRTPDTKSSADVEKIVQKKAQWIFKKQLHFIGQKKPVFSLKSLLLIYGKNYKIKIIPNNTEKTCLNGDVIEFHISQKKYNTKQIKAQYDAYLRKKAYVLFPKWTKVLAEKIDVHPTKINIKELRGRWGSATATGAINLNSNLIKAPKKIIRYVIFHELCHFKIKEHSHHFWNLMGQHMPEYKESIKWLEANGIKIS